jgi:hypothetical protein
MQKTGDCFKTREKTQWETWLLWGRWLERGKWFLEIVCCNVLVVEIKSSSDWFWGYEVVPIFESEKHLQKNTRMIVLDGKL